MKKRNDIKKEVKKIKKTEDSTVNKRRRRSEPDPWKEIRLKLKPQMCALELASPTGFEPVTLGLEMRGFVVTNCIELYRFVILQQLFYDVSMKMA